MTMQIRDGIKYKGKQYCTLANVLQFNNKAIAFKFRSFSSPHTALKSGFHWDCEVIDNKLFLIYFRGFVRQKNTKLKLILLPNLFKEKNSKFFVSWFSGEIPCFLDNNLTSKKNIEILIFEKGIFRGSKKIARDDYFSSPKTEKSELELQYDAMSDEVEFLYYLLINEANPFNFLYDPRFTRSNSDFLDRTLLYALIEKCDILSA